MSRELALRTYTINGAYAAFEQSIERLRAAGASVATLTLPPSFEGMHASHQIIMAVDAAHVHQHDFARAPETYHPKIASLIETGLVAGVLDLTTTEWADEHVGGILGAGPTRLEAAARAGVPAVIAPGCLDMVNFGEPDTVPAKFSGRTFYHHNPQVTLMRTSADECLALGKLLAEKINLSTGPVKVLLPWDGISVISQPDGPFHDGAADEALFDTLKVHLRDDIAVEELDCSINAPQFAEAAARALLSQLD